jgi:hypothetical protein
MLQLVLTRKLHQNQSSTKRPGASQSKRKNQRRQTQPAKKTEIPSRRRNVNETRKRTTTRSLLTTLCDRLPETSSRPSKARPSRHPLKSIRKVSRSNRHQSLSNRCDLKGIRNLNVSAKARKLRRTKISLNALKDKKTKSHRRLRTLRSRATQRLLRQALALKSQSLVLLAALI